jgi:hypothetical protein
MIGHAHHDRPILSTGGVIMKEQNKAGQNEEFNARPDQDRASQRINPSADHAPMITCDCARWGSPYPHYFWDEARETAGATDAAIMAR